ncbi:hypothetical protein N8I77_011895 [Diaporthe amygdali]|uniref:DUF6594 domain-containing protein n=1 Tax=Phomopsis amygdali TaxID=1214568 RepID=A0AAD9VXN2_PHOAM|nr:hypothetical protein N8I77_011895 [Diaporthe amygdali]
MSQQEQATTLKTMSNGQGGEKLWTLGFARKLVDYTFESVDIEEDFHFLRFEFLQRLNIVKLENELTQIKSRLYQPNYITTAKELDDLRTRLHEYTAAIRDYQYLQDKKPLSRIEAQNRKFRLHRYFYSAAEIDIDPWESHYSYFQDEHTRSVTVDPLRRRLIEYLPVRFTFSRQEREKRLREYEQGELPREVSGFVDTLARFIIAIAGGACLIVPMVIMTLSPSEVKSLVTVSVAMIMFSLILSFGIRVSNIETLVSTATYAAVLVVFVGTNSSGDGGSL